MSVAADPIRLVGILAPGGRLPNRESRDRKHFCRKLLFVSI
jgi:hypothetical protein